MIGMETTRVDIHVSDVIGMGMNSDNWLGEMYLVDDMLVCDDMMIYD